MTEWDGVTDDEGEAVTKKTASQNMNGAVRARVISVFGAQYCRKKKKEHTTKKIIVLWIRQREVDTDTFSG